MNAYVKLYRFTQNTPSEVSFGLSRRGVTHMFLNQGNLRTVSGKIKNQPIDVVLALNSLRYKPVRPTAVLLFGHAHEIVNPVQDIKTAGDDILRWVLYDALTPSEFTSIQTVEHKPHEHIERVSPPSFLDRYNTVQCKITPYALRQEAHKMAMGYLAGQVNERAAKKFFGTSLKLEPISEAVFSERGKLLRKALSECTGWDSIDAKAIEYGFDRFELTYVAKSFLKLYKKKDAK